MKSDCAVMEEFIDDIKVVINALGYKVLEPLLQKKNGNDSSDDLLMNYTKACNLYSGFSAPVSGMSTIGYAEKALFSGLFRHISHYKLCIKDGRKIDPACGSGNFLTETYLSPRMNAICRYIEK